MLWIKHEHTESYYDGKPCWTCNAPGIDLEELRGRVKAAQRQHEWEELQKRLAATQVRHEGKKYMLNLWGGDMRRTAMRER